MKVNKKIILMLLSLSIILMYCLYTSSPSKKSGNAGALPVKHKGVAITLFDSNNNDKWYDENLPKIKKIGAELEVVTAVYVQNEIDPNPVSDPNIEDKLNRLFRKAKHYGVKISLIKPHIMTPELGDNFNRTTYNPSNPNLFFEKWKEIMAYYALICKQNNVPILSISCETAYLSQNIYISKWQAIINQLKLINKNLKTTIALTKGEFDREIQYYEKNTKCLSNILDYVSLDMYPTVKKEVNGKIKISDDYFGKLENSYGSFGYVYGIKKAHQYFHKDIIITETGARWDDSINHVDQNQWVKVVLSVLLQMDEIKGVYVWHVNYPFQFLDTPTAETIKKIYKKY